MPPEPAPDLTVSIVTWNCRDELRDCLCSLPDATAGITAETIVVDNASEDDPLSMVRAEFPGVRTIQNAVNRGFGAAHNQAIAGARGRYVLVLNPDSRAHPGALTDLVRWTDVNPEVGIAGPRVENPDGTIQYSCRRYPSLSAGLFRDTVLGRLFPGNRFAGDYLMTDFDHESVRDVDWVSGCALLIRRECLDRVGPFDEGFFMYSEDVDLCKRAHDAGWRVTYVPEATVMHIIGRSSDKVPHRMIWTFHQSTLRFFRKHVLPDAPLWLRVAAPAGIYARATAKVLRNKLRIWGERLARR